MKNIILFYIIKNNINKNGYLILLIIMKLNINDIIILYIKIKNEY